MGTLFTASLLAGCTFAATLTSAQANASSQQCNTRWSQQDLVGQYLTQQNKEKARVDSRAASVVVNRNTPEFEPTRLRIFTDNDGMVIRMYCG
jgi:hypothetical protein